MALLVAIAPQAGSHAKQLKSGVTIAFTDEEASPFEIPVLIPDDPDVFSGTVASANPKCEAKRTVTVYKKTGKAKDFIGRATTADNGTWSLQAEDPGTGTYVAEVRKLVLARETDSDEEDAETVHRHLCRSVKSKPIEATDG
ncbi:MAG: hypothetical protein WD826_00655 [Actinomycetota bacterium]